MHKATRVLLLAGALSVSACVPPRFLMEAENARTNTHIALAFEETVFNKHHVREGFSRYVAADYREHDAGLPDGFDGSAKALDMSLSGPLANSHVVVQRSVAQHDLVAVEALWDQHPGEGGDIARVDIYRLVNARIVEHWSVQQSTSPSTNGKAAP